jgi:pSer/pThr/pTyr-binding forkhead associated (FHA) protein
MNEKLAILKALLPEAILKATTPDAVKAAPLGKIKSGLIRIESFPFRVGREARVALVDGELMILDRRPRTGHEQPSNDLYLHDSGTTLNISREHFQIDSTPDGFVLVDRGSACGTSLNGVLVGGNDAGGSASLHDGDTVGIGGESTPYLFTFVANLTLQ